MAEMYFEWNVPRGGTGRILHIGHSRTDTLVDLMHGSDMDDTVIKSLHIADDTTSYKNTSGSTAWAIVTITNRTTSGLRKAKIFVGPNDDSETGATEVWDSEDMAGGLVWDTSTGQMASSLFAVPNNNYILLKNTSGVSSRTFRVSTSGPHALVIES